MREDKSFSAESDPSLRITHAPLSWPQWEALPVSVRITDRLVTALIVALELRADLETKEGAPLAEMMPDVERVIEQVDALLKRLAS